LRHDIDGLLVPQGDPEALIGALDRLMGDESLRMRFSERAVEARERFSVTRIATQWEALFRELLDE
jgi:glycosyltransferase involved in cell wall biosynthesis